MMNEWIKILNKFLFQTQTNDLKYSTYPKEWSDLVLRISFGMGVPARIPWIAFITPEMKVSEGFYPVYLYYKESQTLILAYGISETMQYSKTWPEDIMSTHDTLTEHFGKKVARYGDSYVYKSYKIKFSENKIQYFDNDKKLLLSENIISSDLEEIVENYKKLLSIKSNSTPTSRHGVFYMEKQLEDFIIHNWNDTELGKKYKLIIKDGELLSQQYKTDIGFIDILVKDKETNSHVVIELKKNQTSDDTVGQVTRYMGWVKRKLNDKDVKGIIIAGAYDKKLEYALEYVENVNVFIYEVDFKLTEFKGII
tara:strand:- start:1041 stop:1970 length:930 start_codon:yes stop_codon:yes gene_type:complete